MAQYCGDAVPELTGMVADLDARGTRPQGVFLVGSGVDIAALKPRLEATIALTVSAPEQPEMALARGAALASANAALLTSSTGALAYAQDPGTGAIDPYALAPRYLAVPEVSPGGEPGEHDLAYSAVSDEDADAYTVVFDSGDDNNSYQSQARRPVLVAGSAVAVIVMAAPLALEMALAFGVRPAVALRPNRGHDVVVPAQQAVLGGVTPRAGDLRICVGVLRDVTVLSETSARRPRGS